ncbi:MAG: methionine adenosyltransferase, partial [Spirochaetales bacterium]|nr:methionine adenosyltransferase [Spirochaetales bacterium]
MENRKYYFTSESVSEGHPDKLCDQISDAVLDKCLEGDPESRVACETYAATGMVLVGGEITTHSFVDIQQVVRDLVKKIGYTKADYGLDYESMAVMNIINSQSPDISQGVTTGQG